MKEIFAFIEQKKQEFAQLPFFEFLQDNSIDPRQRLAFTPCIAPFAMGFGEMNKDVFREEPTNDPIQKIINKHTREDDHHWLWFLHDLQQLGYDQTLSFSDALKFLWSEETKIPRQVIYEIYRHSFQAEPIKKLIVIEAIEATGNVMSSMVAPISQEIKIISNKECVYFGEIHLSVETGHTMCINNIIEIIDGIQFTEKTRQKAFELVENVFNIFTEFMDTLLIYAKTHSYDSRFIK
ncbi:MAG: hypothetical protein PUP91_34020 [Rhizonema sp. PD37]|nr:hypothetical protein [Rhizonema sp. PD37]